MQLKWWIDLSIFWISTWSSMFGGILKNGSMNTILSFETLTYEDVWLRNVWKRPYKKVELHLRDELFEKLAVCKGLYW